MDELKPEIIETSKLNDSKGDLTKSFRDEKGRWLKGIPHGGRAVGSKNKFQQLKYDLLEAWKTAKGKQKFLEMLNSTDKADFKWAVERIVAILPKESLIDIDATVGEPKVLIVINDPTEKKADGNK